MSNKKFYIKTFGCQMNEHDSAKMKMLLQNQGHLSVSEPKKADIILFNTCTVREKSHHKAISEVGRALKWKSRRPELIVGITGCVAQEERSNLFNIFPDLDIILGPDQLSKLPGIINDALNARNGGSRGSFSATELINDYESYNFVAVSSFKEGGPSRSITIMKGCNNFCTFCIVPYVRGREVSRSPEEIIAEIKGLTKVGVREIMLLGQNVNSYTGSFPKLIKRIAEETDILRIRYTSPHPKDISDELIEEHKNNEKLCEHIHLPVQAGSSNVLKRMNRRYTREQFIDLTAKIRSEVSNITISTDMIVGFPGETEEEFGDTLKLMEEIKFDGMFAFKYSERSGTKAAEKYKDDIPERVKLARLSQVLELNEIIVLQKNEKYVGTRQEILVEGQSRKGNNQLTGRTRTNRIVNFESCDKKLIGKICDIKIISAGPNSLKGIF